MSEAVTEPAVPAPPPRETVLTALEEAHRRIAGDERFLVRHGGRVSEVSPTHYSVRGLSETARLGDLVSRRNRKGGIAGAGEVVRITQDGVLVAPYEEAGSVGLGEAVFNRGQLDLAPAPSWRGRVVDALGRPADGKPAPTGAPPASGFAPVTPPAMQRQRVSEAFRTGVRVIDIFTPLCHGQRLGVFAGSGVGKSTLLSMLANADAFDTVVIALVGERGREVREFLEDTIGPQGMAKSVAVVATSDESAMMRRRAPDTAMSVAEYFRDRGDRVLLILDSITRFAHALREVSIGAGEPPVARGYPASVFTELPRLLERAGARRNRPRLHHRNTVRPCRRRRSQRPGCRRRTWHSRRSCRARPRHCRTGTLSTRQSAGLYLAPCRSRLETRRKTPRNPATLHDRPF